MHFNFLIVYLFQDTQETSVQQNNEEEEYEEEYVEEYDDPNSDSYDDEDASYNDPPAPPLDPKPASLTQHLSESKNDTRPKRESTLKSYVNTKDKFSFNNSNSKVQTVETKNLRKQSDDQSRLNLLRYFSPYDKEKL